MRLPHSLLEDDYLDSTWLRKTRRMKCAGPKPCIWPLHVVSSASSSHQHARFQSRFVFLCALRIYCKNLRIVSHDDHQRLMLRADQAMPLSTFNIPSQSFHAVVVHFQQRTSYKRVTCSGVSLHAGFICELVEQTWFVNDHFLTLLQQFVHYF